MKDKETVSWQDRKASERFAMISPLLADDIDPAKRVSSAHGSLRPTTYRKGPCTGLRRHGAGTAIPVSGP